LEAKVFEAKGSRLKAEKIDESGKKPVGGRGKDS
jgi:hypothetical protein